MAMNFPDSPSVNDEFTVGDQTWIWTGTTWDTVPLTEYSPSPHATTHELGGSDELTLDPTQVTGLDELNTGTEGFTAVSNGSSGLSYQPISHNYIINGAFDIWQRGDSFSSVSDEYTADRWTVTNGIGDVTKSTDVPNDSFQNSLLFEAGAESFSSITTRLEANDTYALAGQTVTFSAYVKVNQAALDNSGEFFFQTPTTKDNFSASLTIAARITFSTKGLVADTWQRVKIDLDFSSLAGNVENGLQIRFDPTRGSTAGTATIYITGVQLEAGSIATPFKRNANSIAGEKLACQRYYTRLKSDKKFPYFGLGHLYSTTAGYMGIKLPTTMRTTPTIGFSPLTEFSNKGGIINISSFSVDSNLLSPDFINIQVNVTSGTTGQAFTIIGNNSSEVFIEAKAEL